jgi:transcriptional regulator with XRE-family HTH domain
MNAQFGNTLKALRQKQGLTQKELGEKVDLSPSYIGQLEQGRSNPSYEAMDKLICALDADANLFFGRRTPSDHQESEMARFIQKLEPGQKPTVLETLDLVTALLRASDNSGK